MAVRVENTGEIPLGSWEATATVSHIRAVNGADSLVKALGTPIVVAVGERFVIPSGGMDALYVSGEFTDVHMAAMARSYWEDKTWTIDAMTDATTPVAVSGYTQGTHSLWSFTTEDDPA